MIIHLKSYTPFLITFSFLLFGCNTSENSNAIEIQIAEHKLDVDNKILRIQYKIHNNTDTTFLLFAFGNIHSVDCCVPEGKFKQEDIPAGHAFLIFDPNNNNPVKEIHPHDWPDSFFENLSKPDKYNGYIENMLVINPGDTTVSYTVELITSVFVKGDHLAKSIYYFGNNSSNFVDSTIQMDLEQKYKGKVYRGYLESNSVKVNYKD